MADEKTEASDSTAQRKLKSARIVATELVSGFSLPGFRDGRHFLLHPEMPEHVPFKATPVGLAARQRVSHADGGGRRISRARTNPLRHGRRRR